MDFLPIFLNIKAQRTLVVGGGQIALRKVTMLLRAGALIRLVAPVINKELQKLLADSEHEVFYRSFDSSDLNEIKLVVAATDDESVNQTVFAGASEKNLPVNVVDNPALCSFIFPSVVDRSPVVVAVSSSGKSPVLARILRSRLETFIPSSYGALANLLGDFRQRAKQKITSLPLRLRFWESILNGPVAELVMSGKNAQAQDLLLETLDNLKIDSNTSPQGEVYLVGAGPGDPDLLTFRALRLMQQADIVLYDRLVTPEILKLCRQDAEKVHVGKQSKNHTMPQTEISKLLVTLAQDGKRVLRLKGGDPFIFGRGGEEIEKLAAAKIPFQIVPGITAASGCSTYAGIPLTHRDYSQSVRFLTGHLKDDSCDLDWESLVKTGQTLVFYMGLISLPIICEQLIKHGRNKETPIALIQQGTTPNQKEFIGTLNSMPGIVSANKIQAPTMIIVGEVVSLYEKLAWKK